MNVKTTFLNEELKEEIYIKQPIGIDVKGDAHKVCYLNVPSIVSSNCPGSGS